MRTRAAVVLLLALACCGGGAASRRGGPVGGKTQLDDAAQQGREMVLEAYASVRKGALDSLQTILAPTVLVVGPGAADVYLSRSDAAVALAGAIEPGRRHRVTSRGLVAGAASAHAVWVADTVDIDGAPWRLSAVVADVDGLWQVLAVHLARAIPDDRAQKLAGDGKLAAPAPLADAVDPAAREAGALFREAAGAPDRVPAQLADRAEVVALGSAPRDVGRGAAAIKRLWKRALAAHPTHTPQGGLRAGVTPDGALAWVCGNVAVARGGGAALPHRFLYLYVRAAGTWRLVSLHDSIGVPR